MNYVILAAGMGTRLHPFTKNYAKCMLNIGCGETVIQRTVRLIRNYDPTGVVTVVVGFKYHEVRQSLNGCDFVYNPFYSITNSIASLWFARHLLTDNVTIINGDVVISAKLMEKMAHLPYEALVFLDSSVKANGDYNVQVSEGRVVAMSKELDNYFGEYAGVTILNKEAAGRFALELGTLIDDGHFNEWYENALVSMILNSDFRLGYFDVADYEWTELDSINNLLAARKIQLKECGL